MVHVNKKYINTDGSVNETNAKADHDAPGFAIISLLFDVENNRQWVSIYFVSILVSTYRLLL